MKKNVLLIITNLNYGGAQRSFSKLSFELNKKYNLYACVFNTHLPVDYPISGHFIDLNIPASNNYFSKIFHFIRRVVLLKRVKKKFKIDTTISFLEGADYVNLLADAKDKKIISIRGSKSHDELIVGLLGGLRRKFLIPWLYQKANQIVVVNNGIKQELLNDFNVRDVPITVIPNWYDTQLLERKSKEVLDEKFDELFNNFVVCSSGRLSVEKGYQHLIEVYAELLKRVNCKLLLIGDGDYKDVLFDKCTIYGLTYHHWQTDSLIDSNKDVFFLGYQENPWKYISKSKVFVLTSSSEGFPNALVEAMACDVPVISTDCPSGPREILSNTTNDDISTVNIEVEDYGILLPTFSNKRAVRSWVSAIEKILLDNTLQVKYKERAKERIQHFNKESIIKLWFNIVNH